MHKRTIFIVLLALLLLFVFVTVWWIAPGRQPAKVAAAFDSLRTNRYDGLKKSEAESDMVNAGDDALVEMARALQQKDTALDRKYAQWRAKLPATLQETFPERPSKNELRRAIASALYDMGPIASCALVGVIEQALDPKDGLGNMEVLRALYWSIPESPKAISILSNYLAHPQPGLALFGMKDAREIWPTVPYLAPLLTNWLRFADTSAEASEALGLMGTDARPFIPLLIEAATNGVAGRNTNLYVSYTRELETNVLHRAKAAALRALGELGVGAPEVLETLKSATTNTSSLLRAAAADALGSLGPAALPALPFLLANLDEAHAEVLPYQLEAIGKMGPGAKQALPILLRFSTAEEATKERASAPFGRIIRWEFEPLPIPLASAVSLAQIDPESARQRIDYLWRTLAALIQTNAFIQLRPLKNELVPLAQAALNGQESEPWMRTLLAYHLLILAPENQAARAFLEREMEQAKDPSQRSSAARWHYLATGQKDKAVQTFSQTLKTVVNLESQSPLTLVAELGPAGRDLAPLVRPLLKHDDRIIRMLAGKALRAIAPDQMPPIKETAE